jgi:hypothetical protein
MRTHDAWLSLTPEPERELPETVATLRADGDPSPEAVTRERAVIERRVVRAHRGAWLAYLREVVELIDRRRSSPASQVQRARAVAIDVVRNHHRLLLGIPGPAAEETTEERAWLEAA